MRRALTARVALTSGYDTAPGAATPIQDAWSVVRLGCIIALSETTGMAPLTSAGEPPSVHLIAE
jgi:hypothetical protein